MAGNEVSRERHVRAGIDRVWAVLTDIAGSEQTLSGVERVELLTEGPYRVGTRWRETRRMFGKEATEELVVTGVEAPTRTVIEAESAGTHYVSELTLTPVSAQETRLTMSFAAAPTPGQGNPVTRLLGRLLAPLGAKAAGKMIEQDLRDIAARAEADPV